jgi:putative cell wall-binding protein
MRAVAVAVAAAVTASVLAISGAVDAKTPTTAARRIQGTDRYATALAVATQYTSTTNNAAWANSANLILASGENFPDALAASALSQAVNAPIILTRSGELPASVRDWLLTRQSTFTASVTGRVYVVGGTSAISDDVVNAVLATINVATDTTPHLAVRLGGDNRYETARLINAVSGVINATDAIVLVSGSNFADAVAVAPLARQAGWPIVPVAGGALDTNATTTIASYITAAGGVANARFVIMGGTSVMPVALEEAIVGLGVPYRNIVRIAGADRYETALNLNVALVTTGIHGQTMNGQAVALVSGENFPDALAAGPFLGLMGVHGMLSNSTAVNARVATLMGALGNGGLPNNLWVIGGTSAIADEVHTGAAAGAQAGGNINFTAMVCTEGSASVFLTFAEGAANYKNNVPANGDAVTEATAIRAAFTRDGVAIAGVTSGIFVDLNGNGVVDAISVTLPAAISIAAGSTTLNFLGVNEATGGNDRAFGTASCSLTKDTVPPALTLTGTAQAGGTTTTLFVSAAENLNCAANVDITKLSVGATVAAAGTATVSAASSARKLCQITLNATAFAGVGVGTTVAAAAGFLQDTAGNANAAPASGVVVLDAANPTVASSSVACVQTAAASATAGTNLTVTAISPALGGTKFGVPGNSYRVSIVNQRGMLRPTVAVDDTAKTITVTADTAYHLSEDIAQAVANAGGNADWAFTGAGAIAPTVIAATTTGGTQTCTVTLIASEAVTGFTVASVVVNSVALSSGAGAGQYDAATVGFSATDQPRVQIVLRPTSVVAAGSIAVGGSMTDVAGNTNAAVSLVVS